jgi:transposase InsO family protein
MTLVRGRRFRILTVVDDFTRECLALVVDTSLTGPRVVRELDRIVESRGGPRMIVSDNGGVRCSGRKSVRRRGTNSNAPPPMSCDPAARRRL